jgi:hypothetical protein
VLFWGDPSPYIAEAHRRNTKVFIQVGSIEEATATAAMGVDALIVKGRSRGAREEPHLAVNPCASGGRCGYIRACACRWRYATGRGVVAALNLGAQAVSMGRGFLCSTEAAATRALPGTGRQQHSEDTVYTTLFDGGWSHAPTGCYAMLRSRSGRLRLSNEWAASR